MNGKERDERKMLRAYGCMDRARALLARIEDGDRDRRRLKRAWRLQELGTRIMAVRSIRFRALRAAGQWPRA